VPAGDEIGVALDGPGEDVAQKGGGGLLGGALGRPDALDLAGHERGDEPEDRGRGHAPPGAEPHLTDLRRGQAQRQDVHVLALAVQDGLLPRRGRHREHRARAVDDRERGVERPGHRTHHLGQPRAGLHRGGHGGERLEACRGLPRRRGGGHAQNTRGQSHSETARPAAIPRPTSAAST